MAAGLNEGVVSQSSTFNNQGFVQVEDARIKNVEQSVNGTRTMSDVLKYSLNTGVVHILSQLGGGNINAQARDKLYEYYRSLRIWAKLPALNKLVKHRELFSSPARFKEITLGIQIWLSGRVWVLP